MKSCLNCKSSDICRAYFQLYEVLNTQAFKAAIGDNSKLPGVRGEILRTTAANCWHYERDNDER